MEEDCNWLEVIFSNVTLEDISQADVAICYYVSGYIARRIDNQRKCTSCKKLLISSNTSSEVTESLFEEHQKAVQNGKPWRTCRASAFCFATTVFAMQLFNALASNAKKMKRLLTLHGLYLRTLLLQSRMQADSVILPISNVAQTTQTLSSLFERF